MRAKIGVLTMSDRASAGVYEDVSGKAIKEILSDYIVNECEFIYEVIPDEMELICEAIKNLTDEHECDLVVTTGGTGPALRDVTPEATEAVCDKMLPGFGELMRMESLKYVPTAILSRQSAGIRKKSLVINLPGQPKSIKECLDAVFPAVPYCLDLIGATYLECKNIEIFRPKKR